MVIYSHNGSTLLNVNVDDSSYRYEEIMGDSIVLLEFALTEHVEIDPGSYILYKGEKYELMSRESVTIQHTRNYEYKATFSGPQARFSRYVMYNNQDGRLKFDMFAQPITLLTMVIWNLNNREPGMWEIGDYVEKEQRLVSFNHTSVRDALNAIASAFDTEWSVEPNGSGFVINLRKVEFNKDNPLALKYGKDQGFKPGVGRLNYGDYGQVERVWIDGGERNLSIGKYGYTTLHFPRGLSFSMDKNGNYRYTVNGQTYTQTDFGPYNEGSSLSFVTDEWGASVKLASAASSCVEVSLDLTEYYPKRVGKTTGVFYLYKGDYLTYNELITAYPDVDWSEVQVDIVDTTLSDDEISGSNDGLDYSKYQFSNDDPLTVIFQNGNLAGREFNATFYKEAKKRTIVNEQTGEEEEIILRPANRFELERNTIDGVDMPNGIFRPNVSEQDDYIVTNCYLPDEYICNYPAFEGAELDALREACKFIRDNKDPQFTFKGEVDGLYAKRNWDAIGGKLILGGCISFQDDNIQPTPIVTRIMGIKEYVNNPYSPEITMSNETVKGGMSSMMASLKAADEHVIERVNEARRFSRRSFRDAKETIAMLAGALDYFSEGINPITVETMSLLVGDESLQFQFWHNRECTQRVVNPVVYDEDARKLRIPECVIQHMTLGIADVKPWESRNADEYLRWSMPAFNSATLRGENEDGSSVSDTAFYVYAKVDADNVAKPDDQRSTEELTHIVGEFLLSKTKMPFRSWEEGSSGSESEGEEGEEGDEPVSGGRYYHLLVGILNSEYEGSRSFAPMYGFTEVLPGQITTDVIRSANGDSYFDLVNNQFALGESLKFINNQLSLNGAFIQRGDDRYNLGAFRGQWTVGTQYEEGDEVWWQAPNGTISSYIYIYPNPTTASASNDPSHSNYWQVFAQGVVGSTGQSSFKSTIFCRTNETPIAPGSGVGSFPQPNPPSETSWQVFKEGNTPISGVYWHDGIPAGEEILWATNRIFTSDSRSPQQANWSTPRQMTDTDTFDVEFAYAQTGDADPATPTDANRHGGSGTQVWFDPVLDPTADWTEMYWRAERECVNGEWGNWVIVRVKGEKGSEGNGISDVKEYYAFSNSGNTPPSSWPWPNQNEDYPDTSGHAGEYLWTKTVISYTDPNKEDKVIYTALYIPTGAKGDTGAYLVSRGWYDRNDQNEYDMDGSGNVVHQVYYGNAERRDVVYFEDTQMWYMTNVDAGEFSNQAPAIYSSQSGSWETNTAYWSEFMSNLPNIATGFAFIDRLVVKNFNTAGQGNNASKRIVAEQNAITMYDSYNRACMIISGDPITASGTSETIQMSAKPSLISVDIVFPTDTIRHSSYIATGDTYPANVTVLGTANVKVNQRTVGFTVGANLASGSVRFEIRNYIVIDNTKTLLNSYAIGVTSANSSRTFSLNYPEKIFTLGAGNHTIYHTSEVIVTGPDAMPTSNGKLTISAGVSAAGTIVVTYPTLKTEIGSNGFRVMLSSDMMAQFTAENGSANLLIRSSNYGIWISDGFMKMMLGTANEWKTVINDNGFLKLTT